MHPVTSNAVFNAINVCFPIVSTQRFAYIIRKNTIARYTGSAGKTVVIIFAIYRHNPSFSVQISCGASDPTVQQMSGEGREGFQTVTQNSAPVAIDNFYKYYRVSFQISSNSNYVGIGTDADIGISDYHYE